MPHRQSSMSARLRLPERGHCSHFNTVDEDGEPVGDEPNTVACACTARYKGDSCEHDVGECGTRPCIYGD